MIRRRRTQSSQNTQSQVFSAGSAVSAFIVVILLIAVLVMTACGKKGAPLPPLVKLPVAPENFVAERRGDVVDLQFKVPATNTDGTRPANVRTISSDTPAASGRPKTGADTKCWPTSACASSSSAASAVPMVLIET